jgi:pilus assembly protein CpaC
VTQIRIRVVDIVLLAGLALCASALRAETASADTLPEPEQIRLATGKTRMIDTAINIRRVAVAAPEIAEAVPVSPRSIMLNGHLPGETSLIVWLDDGSRREFDVNITIADSRLEAVRRQLASEFGDAVGFKVDNGTVYLSGKVRDIYASQRAVSIVDSLGRVVNLLNLDVPPRETQILLKVRFADVDRTRSTDLGISFAGVAGGIPFAAGTGAYPQATVTSNSTGSNTVSLSDALNLLLFDPHLNIGATLKDLEGKALLQILAEPNVLALNGHPASFISGGEVPVPVLQGGTGAGTSVSVTFHQFGVQIRFLPVITPRGTIRLHVAPEVSSLDYSNAVTLSGSTIPAISERKIETDVELADGQSFAIAGLLDRRTTDSWSRMPGFADIPLFGKLFQSRSTTKSNSELLVIVTIQLVAPIEDPKAVPDLDRPIPFLKGDGILNVPPQTPGPDKTGPVSMRAPRESISVQEMEKFQKDLQNQTNSVTPPTPAALGVPLAGPTTTPPQAEKP